MILWRISDFSSLAGIGAELASARWHSAEDGKRIVYLAEHPALALIENLVNLESQDGGWPVEYRLMKIRVERGVLVRHPVPRQLPDDWQHRLELTRALGDAWLAGRRSALLRVPSAAAPESCNFLLNPLHPAAAQLRAEWHRPLRYDRRLFRLAD